ncbi:MAG: response regulator transcription factor [Erysipelotrichaceae bacterium]
MYILVVEDEKHLGNALKQILIQQKYQVDVANTGILGFELGSNDAYDLIILDIMLPGMNGYEVANALRAKGLNTPILMLSAKDQIPDKVMGLDQGADDYMTKPFAPEELLARVRALARRKEDVVRDEQSFHDLRFYTNESLLVCKEKQVALNYKEAEILKLLLAKPHFILSKEEMIVKVWGWDSEATDSNVEAYISFLRKKLSFVGSTTRIVAIKKQGYRLEESDVTKTKK